MSEKTVRWSIFDDLYNEITATAERITALSNRTQEYDNPVVLMDIAEDLVNAQRQRVDEIWARAKSERAE